MKKIICENCNYTHNSVDDLATEDNFGEYLCKSCEKVVEIEY